MFVTTVTLYLYWDFFLYTFILCTWVFLSTSTTPSCSFLYSLVTAIIYLYLYFEGAGHFCFNCDYLVLVTGLFIYLYLYFEGAGHYSFNCDYLVLVKGLNYSSFIRYSRAKLDSRLARVST